jgi:hypothetical protein
MFEPTNAVNYALVFSDASVQLDCKCDDESFQDSAQQLMQTLVQHSETRGLSALGNRKPGVAQRFKTSGTVFSNSSATPTST